MKELDLTFSDFLQSFDLLGKSEWITVYSHNYTDEESVTFWTALLPKKAINKALTDPSWDLSIGDGSPGYSFTFRNGREIARYHRYFDGIEPLIYARSFNGMKEGYNELSEEFKLLFNLYEDKRGQKFIYIDDNGDDEEVVIMSPNKIQIKLRLLKRFLAVKNVSCYIFSIGSLFNKKSRRIKHS